MESDNNEQNTEDANQCSESVNFSNVTAVAAQWMLDFMFVSLCRRFKEDELLEFDETLETFEDFFHSTFMRGNLSEEKVKICAFLSRVMHGKDLDVQFDEEDHVMPLMSAANIWSGLKQCVADESLYNTIANLLVVQAVAVCLEQGEKSSASFALKWFENNEFPQNLIVKLTTIVTQGETYHPFFTSFSFSRLTQTVQSFLDAYLEKNPSNYILKKATKKVQSSQDTEDLDDVKSQDSAMSEETNKSSEDRKKKGIGVCLRTKRKLLSTKVTDVWKPETCSKAIVSVKRFSVKEISQMKAEPADTSVIYKRRKRPQKWGPEEDRILKAGVRRHGPGKWSRILLDYDFQGRTGTMLKDRWRVLQKRDEVP